MIKRLADRVFSVKRVAGIYINTLSGNEKVYHMVLVRNNQGSLFIEKTAKSNDYNEILKEIPSNVPLVINMDGKGILHKKIRQHDKNDGINDVMPNINKDDFFIQQYTPDAEHGFVSLVRKDTFVIETKILESGAHHIVDAVLGPFSAVTVNLVKAEEGLLVAGNHTLHVKDNMVTSLEPYTGSELSYNPGDMQLSSALLPVLSRIVAFISGNHGDVSFLNLHLSGSDEFKYSRLFRFTGVFMLAFLFIALMGNYMLFEGYNKKLNLLTFKVQQNKSELNKLEALKKEAEFISRIVANSGLNRQSRFYYYADRMALLLPDKVILNELWVQPVPEKLKENSEINYERRKIHIKGSTAYSILLNNWINKLNHEEWVKNVSIVNYMLGSNNTSAVFELEIELQ